MVENPASVCGRKEGHMEKQLLLNVFFKAILFFWEFPGSSFPLLSPSLDFHRHQTGNVPTFGKEGNSFGLGSCGWEGYTRTLFAPSLG